MRRAGVRATPVAQSGSDPRYVRLLPLVVSAKLLIATHQEAVQRFNWWRMFKMVVGVFCFPAWVAWTCFRKQITIRQLLLIATAVGVAISIILADRSNFLPIQPLLRQLRERFGPCF